MWWSRGTSINGLQDIADGAILGITIGGGFNQILAETLGIARTTEIAPTATLRGEITEDNGIARVAMSPSGGGRITLTPDAEGRFDTEVSLAGGVNRFTVRATDRAGNTGEAVWEVMRRAPITLYAPDPNSGSATLRLDAQALTDLLPEDGRRDITLLEVPLRPTIQSALRAIRDPVAYGVDPTQWSTAQRNLYRLLNMTPDTADLRGSSVEELLALGNAIGLPTPRLLADILGIAPTDPILPIPTLTDIIMDDLIATHPNTSISAEGAPVLIVSLEDALGGLSELGTRFGPTQDHPGFLGPMTQAQLLEPGFSMALRADSTLAKHDGVHAAEGDKDYLFVRRGEQALEFDFLDPDAFTVVGLVDQPSIDLTVRIGEHPTFLSAGDAREANPVAGSTDVWRGDGDV